MCYVMFDGRFASNDDHTILGAAICQEAIAKKVKKVVILLGGGLATLQPVAGWTVNIVRWRGVKPCR